MKNLVGPLFFTAFLAALITLSGVAHAQDSKPNILFIVSDDTGYGDLGPYGGGEGRGMPTPQIDRMAAEGMTLFSFYAQPSCTPGRAAMQTGRIPNRSGMTTVAFQGQGGGLPAAEWTLASVLKKADYQTYFTGKWHLGEDDSAMPNAQGYDEMVTISQAVQEKMKTYVEYPPRKIQSETYSGPITLSSYFRFKHIREQLEKEGVKIPLPTGN